MEDVTQTVEQNKIYIVAKEITQTKNEEEKQKLNEHLGTLVQNTFKNKQQEEIENALQMAADLKEVDVMGVIMDDAEIEIENINYDKNGKSYNSAMLLLSCTMITSEKVVELPSILKFQSVIQKHLLESKIIESADQFRLGAIRIDNEAIEDLTMQDWWNIHHNLVDEMGTKENDDKLIFTSRIDVESGITMFHFVPFLTLEDSEKSFLSELMNSSKYDTTWERISKELSTSKVGFNIMAPDFINKGMEEAKFVLQSSKLQLLLNDYQEYDNIEIGYIKLETDGEEADTYVVFFFDNEDNALADFFVFETDGNEGELITMLVNEVTDYQSQKLWHFDRSLTTDELDSWFEEDDEEDEPTIYLTKLLEEGNSIDLNQVLAATRGTAKKYLH